jgi:3-oxoacyl-[acyl-carrier protein] reductase
MLLRAGRGKQVTHSPIPACAEEDVLIDINLAGRVCVVTGASGELGRVISRTLACAGAALALHYHQDEKRAAALLAELRSAGATAILVQADVTSLESVEAMRDAVAAQLGPAAVIINNAVIQYQWAPVLEQPADDFVSQFDSCVMHNVHMVKAFVPDMIKQGQGRVIGVNTECAMQCFQTQAAYASAKRGMDGLLRVLARELGPHQITVNQVAPGWMISERDRSAGTERRPEYEAELPLRRRGSDQDVANAVAFLASDLAGFITGAFLPVCGGNVMPAI